MKYDALIVDFGGVLTTPLQDSIAAFCEAVGIEQQDFVRVALISYSGGEDALVTQFETGAMPEVDFSRELAQRLQEQTGVVIEPEGLVGRIFATIKLELEMLALVEDVRRSGLKTGLLSNSWGADFYPLERLTGIFDDIVISGEVGMRKPDAAIFHLACERLGVQPAGCLFVDDHPGHLEAAKELGMTTVLHISPETTIAEVKSLLAEGVNR